VVERIEGIAGAVETPIGQVPTPESLDVAGLGLTTDQLEKALAVDVDEWREELPQIQQWFEKIGSEKVPAMLWTELDALRARLGAD
jgi:phosphoenolpyruvate carboxykinase (GTP)